MRTACFESSIAACLSAGRRLLAALHVVLLLGLASLVGCGGGGGDEPCALSFTVQPVSQTVLDGTGATFSAAVSCSGTTRRWQRSTDDGASWQDIAGASQQAYSIAAVDVAMNGHRFRAAASAGSTTVFSSAATLTVSAPVATAITAQPADASAVAGGNASFAVTATGTSLSYQWQSSPDGAAWSNLAGATQPTLVLQAVTLGDNGRRYRVQVSNTVGSVTSSAALLSVTAASGAPIVTSQPLSVSTIVGQTATFAGGAIGTPSPTYQWQQSTDGGATYQNIPLANAAAYTTSPAVIGDNGKRFRFVATNTMGSVTSNPAVLSVGAGAAPTVLANPTDQSAAYPYNDFMPNTATFTAAFAGTPTPTLQWQISRDGGLNFSNISGATAARYTTPVLTDADNDSRFRLVATNIAGTTASNPARLGAGAFGFGFAPSGLALLANGDIMAVGFGYVRILTPSTRFVRTLAGDGVSFGLRDGTGATAGFVLPTGVVLDGAGNAYVADSTAVRRVTPQGVVTTFAGAGAAGFTNGNGTLARFGTLRNIAIDDAGNLYVTDTTNHAIRRITPGGEVTTLAGGSIGTADGQGSAASFNNLWGITVSSAGDIYVSDSGMARCALRRITPTGLVSTLTTGHICTDVDGSLAVAGFRGPRSMSADAAGNVFVRTIGGVRKIAPTGDVTTVPNSATEAAVYGVDYNSLVSDAAGNVYIDGMLLVEVGGGLVIRRITPLGAVTRMP